MRDWNCGNHGFIIDSRRSNSPSSEESSDFMETPLVTPHSPPSSQPSSTEPNVVPVPDSEPDADTIPTSDSVPTSRYPTRLRRPPDRRLPDIFTVVDYQCRLYAKWGGSVVVNCYFLIVYPLCLVLAYTQTSIYRVHVRPEARQCVGSGVLAACIFSCVHH